MGPRPRPPSPPTGVPTPSESSGPAQVSARPRSAWTPTAVDPRGAAPLRLGEVLVGAQKYMARQTGAPMTQDEWRKIVGTKIAGRTRVGRLQRGVLVIKVASSAWSNELSFLRPQILAKLQRTGHDVRQLRFSVDQELSAGRTVRRTMASDRAPPEQPSLPPQLIERLQAIEDPNLRAAVAEAARTSLARGLRGKDR